MVISECTMGNFRSIGRPSGSYIHITSSFVEVLRAFWIYFEPGISLVYLDGRLLEPSGMLESKYLGLWRTYSR